MHQVAETTFNQTGVVLDLDYDFMRLGSQVQSLQTSSQLTVEFFQSCRCHLYAISSELAEITYGVGEAALETSFKPVCVDPDTAGVCISYEDWDITPTWDDGIGMGSNEQYDSSTYISTVYTNEEIRADERHPFSIAA